MFRCTSPGPRVTVPAFAAGRSHAAFSSGPAAQNQYEGQAFFESTQDRRKQLRPMRNEDAAGRPAA